MSVYTGFLDFTPIFWMSAILGIHSQFFFTDFLDLVPLGAFFTGISVYTDFWIARFLRIFQFTPVFWMTLFEVLILFTPIFWICSFSAILFKTDLFDPSAFIGCSSSALLQSSPALSDFRFIRLDYSAFARKTQSSCRGYTGRS